MSSRLTLTLLTIALLCSACGGANTPNPNQATTRTTPKPSPTPTPTPAPINPPEEVLLNNGEPQTGLPLISLLVGEKSIEVEAAVNGKSREIGLMYRKQMPENSGMLFVYPERGMRSFWMKNTLIPLSLAYIRDDGVICQIVDMQPAGKDPYPETYPAKESVRYGLEMNLGWFKRNGLKVGSKVYGLEQVYAEQ